MKQSDGMEGFLAFLAGAATGAVFMRWAASGGWASAGDPARKAALEERTRSATAASIQRIHAVLGEIRILMKARKGAATGPEGTAGSVPAAAMETAAAAAEEASEAANPETMRPDGEDRGKQDRTGYARPVPGPAGYLTEGEALAAGAAIAAGAAAAWAALGRNGSRAAWPALGGFLAAAGLVLASRAGLAGRRARPGPPAMEGPWSRRSRSAVS